MPWVTDHEIKIVEYAMRNGWHENKYNYVEKVHKEFTAYHDQNAVSLKNHQNPGKVMLEF